MPKKESMVTEVVAMACRGFDKQDILEEIEVSVQYANLILRDNRRAIEAAKKVSEAQIETLLWEGKTVYEIAEALDLAIYFVVDTKATWMLHYGLVANAVIAPEDLERGS